MFLTVLLPQSLPSLPPCWGPVCRDVEMLSLCGIRLAGVAAGGFGLLPVLSVLGLFVAGGVAGAGGAADAGGREATLELCGHSFSF